MVRYRPGLQGIEKGRQAQKDRRPLFPPLRVKLTSWQAPQPERAGGLALGERTGGVGHGVLTREFWKTITGWISTSVGSRV